MSHPGFHIVDKTIQRSYVETRRSYESAAEAFESAIGRYELSTAQALKASRAPWTEVEVEMNRMAGASGLMMFAMVDQGAITSLSGAPMRSRLYLVGNPAIAEQILRIDIRGCLYVPFRVALFQQNDDGATLSFDRPSSFLSALENPELEAIGRMLDDKIDAVISSIKAV